MKFLKITLALLFLIYLASANGDTNNPSFIPQQEVEPQNGKDIETPSQPLPTTQTDESELAEAISESDTEIDFQSESPEYSQTNEMTEPDSIPETEIEIEQEEEGNRRKNEDESRMRRRRKNQNRVRKGRKMNSRSALVLRYVRLYRIIEELRDWQRQQKAQNRQLDQLLRTVLKGRKRVQKKKSYKTRGKRYRQAQKFERQSYDYYP